MIEQVNLDDPFGNQTPGRGSTVTLDPVRKPPPSQTENQATKDALEVVIANQKIREGELGAAAKPSAIPATAATVIQGNINAFREIDEALEALSKRPGSIGLGTGKVGDYTTQYNDPEGTKTRAKIAKIGAVTLHDLSGAAVSASETPRFMPFIPKVDDTPEVARTKLLEFRRKLEGEIHEALDYYSPKSGYLPYDTPGSREFLAKPPTEAVEAGATSPFDPNAIGEVGAQGQVSSKLDLSMEPRPGEPPMTGAPRPGGPVVPEGLMELTIDNPPGSAAAPPPPERQMNPLTDSFLKGVGNVVEGVGNIPGLVLNPLTAGVNWAAGSEVMGKPDYGANLREALGLPGDDSALGAVLEAGSGALVPAVGAGKVAQSLTNPSALAAFTTLAKQPIRQATAAMGGAAAGEGAKAAGAGPGTQLAANVLGSIVGYGPSKLMPSSGLTEPDIAAAARQQAAAGRQNVRLRRPMFDSTSREAAGNLEGSPGASSIIRGGYRETGEDIERGIGRLTAGGRAQESAETGGAILQSAAQRRVKSVDAQAKVDYGHARRLAGPDAAVTPRKALLQLRDELAKFKETENLSADDISFLRDKVGGDLTKGPITIKGFQRIRRELNRQIVRQELKGSEAEAAANRVIKALRDDLSDSLPPAAAKAFLKADANYSAGWKHINDVLTQFIAKNKEGEVKASGTAALAKLKTWASETSGGDPRRMSAFWNDLDPQEQLDVAATFMNRIGRETPEGDFSPDRFITAMKGVSPEARRTMFGPRGEEAIADLLELSSGLKKARSKINFPGSGRTLKQHIGQLLVFGFLGGGAGGAAGGGAISPGTALGVVGGVAAKTGYDAMKASLLMNPKISSWLAGLATASTPTDVRQRLTGLATIIARNPELAEDLEPIKAKLEAQFGAAPDTKLKAEDTR